MSLDRLNTISNFQQCTVSSRNINVIASCDISCGVSCDDILLKITDINEDIDTKVSTITVSQDNNKLIFSMAGKSKNEEIKLTNGQPLNYIKLADDCHSYNVMIRSGCSPGTVELCTTQFIKKGDHLKLWFSQEMLTFLGVPFLTPINIQGEKIYKCHQCNKIFEYPNPLKIHLSLNCKNISPKNILWKKLYDILVKKNTTKNEEKYKDTKLFIEDKNLDKFNFYLKSSPPPLPREQLPPNNGLILSPNISSNPSSPNHNYEEKLRRPSSEPPNQYQSAFKPYQIDNKTNEISILLNRISTEQLSIHQNINNNPQNTIDNSPQFLPPTLSLFSHHNPFASFMSPQNDSISSMNLSRHNSMERSNLIIQHAVDMETLVSNLGKSKQGHLCIYCGKIYSRKYGLKIHIRTHTGFKPLKCKYCFRPFGDPSNLNKHVRLHAEGDTPYKCELCGKILVRRRDLERHMKSRHQTGENNTNDTSTPIPLHND